MEPWKDELYHSLLTGIRVKVGNAVKQPKVGKSGKSVGKSNVGSTGREWKNHKYIRKEGNRYIYPEDLKRGGSSISKPAVVNTGAGKLGANAGSIKKQVNTPRSRVKNITGKSEDISRKGEGLGTGPVGTGTGRNSTKNLTRSNPMFEDNQITASKIDDYLTNSSVEYWALSNGIKVTGSVLKKLYSSGKSFINSLKNRPDTSIKNPVNGGKPLSALDGTTTTSTSSSSKKEDIPLDVLIAFNNVLDAYIEEQEKKK